MSRSLHTRALNLYKTLYITRNRVFQDDIPVLQNSLIRLRNEFRANKNLTNEAEIKQLLKLGREVNQELETLIQTLPTENPNIYRVRIKKHMIKDNHISN
ncbi:unnamed protein product [Brachionus calyciflorus]|uniref:Complex III assembly factor LYRM7 n=1 Tax=Brachionus calyciflorus TaxID=104777 RepID=A0A813RPM7_9BILA|nr:unnamed protein product [Brachionus calyciflorus]